MLASPSAPLKLADGRLVYPNGEIVDPSQAHNEFIEVPTNREATQLVVSARRKLADLPDVPRTMNTISVVLSYSLFGLSDEEIALATGLTELQVGTVKMNDAYTQMRDTVVGSIIASESDDVRQLFQTNSRMAVNTMLSVLHRSKSEANKISVARDILDRAGHRPADVVEHRHRLDGGLTIEIITRDNKTMPTIDLEVEP
jgi:hypothetical protein